MYNPTQWKDHITQKKNVFIEIDNGDGTITHKKVEGDILQQGTPMDARRFNNMEAGIFAAHLTAAELTRLSQMYNRELEGLQGEQGVVTLRNGQAYPFNDSSLVVALRTPRDNTDYFVDIEIINASGGFAGQVVTRDKLRNGFAISFTGSARTITLRYVVRGGVFR